MDGTLQEIENGYVLRFERRFAYPIEKVWAALTEPARLADWLGGTGSEIELRMGGRVYLAGHGSGIESTVTALDPPRLLEYGWKTRDWDGGPIRWELAPTDDGGTHLVLTHTHPPLAAVEMELPPELEDTDPIARTLAGWHSLLELLALVLDERPEPFSMERWWELYHHYKQEVVSA